jgi:hypothetical protein
MSASVQRLMAREILDADSLEFERGLAAWLSGIDPLSPDFV